MSNSGQQNNKMGKMGGSGQFSLNNMTTQNQGINPKYPFVKQPTQPNQNQGFMLNPNQVANDIALGSGWGMYYGMPQMNPFSMYGQQAAPFNWGAYSHTFGGK
jgi:hypothetical protein